MRKRTEWFQQDRFGLFIHWGLYSLVSRGEWVMSDEELSNEEYDNNFNYFNPKNFKPKEWARLAKKAGMKYAVLTAKHHDGFCLFDSEYTDFKVTNTEYGKDIVREFVDAFRAEGLKVGLYYSLLDWHHEDYPKYGDMYHPQRNNEKYKDEKIDFDNYLKYMHNQVEELCSNYGKLDILWFDYAYGDMRGEKWKAEDLMNKVRLLQPDVIVDNRLETSGEGGGSLLTNTPLSYSGDFYSPEQVIPPKGILNESGKPVPWELCTTMNNNWGYTYYDNDYKSAKMLIRKLVECVSKNGNMILNIGPNGNGEIPQKSIDIMNNIGNWIQKNGESIYGCSALEAEKPEWGRYTKKHNKIYAHIFEQPLGPLALEGIDKTKVKKINILEDGSEVSHGESWVTSSFSEYLFVNFGPIPYFSYKLPDETDTVLEIIMTDE